MNWKLLVKITGGVALAVVICLMAIYFYNDAQRADRVTGASNTAPAVGEGVENPWATTDVDTPSTPEETMPTTPAPDLIEEEPTDEPTAEPTTTSTSFAAPTAGGKSAKLGKYRAMFGGKFRIQIPTSWCQTGYDTTTGLVFVDKGSCGVKSAKRPTIVFGDQTTAGVDLFESWTENACGKGKGGALEGPAPTTLGGKPAEFYRITCVDGSHHYAWNIIQAQDKIVFASHLNLAKLRLIQKVLEGIRW